MRSPPCCSHTLRTKSRNKGNTAEEFGREYAATVESGFSSPGSSVSITNQIVKNEPATIAGKTDAWRLEYITSVEGRQSSYNLDGFVIDDEGKLYKFHFTTSPLTVPDVKPDFEKILQSFRFV
jgi:hypothetical protein